jgi:catechol 2,3-dioxygenase-like lactoylglutathione lyase family enzyme
MPNGISYVSIGVADMAVAEKLWVQALGLEIVARRQGSDPELGKLWKLPADQFIDQMLVRTPGASTGQLHFVQFREPGEAVRKGAAPTDLVAKNIDVNCVGMPELVEKLSGAGYSIRTDISEYEVGDIHAREVQMSGHDGVNIVFIEILSKGFEVEYSPEGFAAITSFVVVVPSTLTESKFYQDIFGFDEIMHHRITGPGIEAAVGLPKGSALDMRLCGSQDNMFGRMEFINYEGLSGENRFSRAVPPATGILRCGFRTDKLDELLKRVELQGTTVGRMFEIDAIFGAGRIVEFVSPAGLQIEVIQPV